MPNLSANLDLDRCPHCAVANPNIILKTKFETTNHEGTFLRYWGCYQCRRCGGVTSAWALKDGAQVIQFFPDSPSVNDDIPIRPKAYLQQALESIHAPAGAVMLAASAVDSMLKLKGYTEGTLYNRIEASAKDHLITKEMATWAHDVRLDANDQRHADESAILPTAEDAQRVVDFATALAEFLFVLPSRVQRGLKHP